MSARATSVTGAVLRWARERAGLSPEEAGSSVSKTGDVISLWEAGEAAPTYLQLEALAGVYKRPIALFFLPAPPEEDTPRREFRTLPDPDLETLESDTLFAVRDAHAYQASLRELTGSRNPADRQITTDLHARLTTDPVQLAARARDYLGISLQAQGAWHDSREAMSSWRDAIEAAGVFVFKRSFDQREISGFCIYDSEFPLIVVNNSTSFTRQIFTLFHELAHLLYGVSSITKNDETLLNRVTGTGRAIEVACNRFAAEFLVPQESFPWQEFEGARPVDAISRIAGRYHVSRETILRRLFDRGLVDSQTYTDLTARWNEEAEGRTGSGGNYYATQATYLSRAFLAFAFGHYHAGNLNISQLAEHIGIKARNIPKFEDFLFGRR